MSSDDPPKLSVVSLHDGRPSLQDIPARLRLLADQLEAGEYDEYHSCLVIIPQPHNEWPIMWGYGDVDGVNSPIITLTLALQMWIDKQMARK